MLSWGDGMVVCSVPWLRNERPRTQFFVLALVIYVDSVMHGIFCRFDPMTEFRLYLQICSDCLLIFPCVFATSLENCNYLLFFYYKITAIKR